MKTAWIGAAALLSLMVANRVEGSAIYTIKDLGTLPGTNQSFATGINDLGQVVGYSNNTSDGRTGNPRPFVYSNGQITSVSPIGGGIPNGINDSGQVVGGPNTSINNSGQYVAVNPGHDGGFLVDGGITTSLDNFTPVAINDSGVIAGQVRTQSGGMDPAIYKNGQVTDLVKTLGLNTLSGESVAINKSGDVYFYYLDLKHGDQPYYSILKADGQLIPAFYAAAMNKSNILVGDYYYENGKTMTQLGGLLVPSSQSLWQGFRATAINDSGQIVGMGVRSDGETHAFLMTPVPSPEPSTLAILAMGPAFLALRSMARRVGRQAD